MSIVIVRDNVMLMSSVREDGDMKGDDAETETRRQGFLKIMGAKDPSSGAVWMRPDHGADIMFAKHRGNFFCDGLFTDVARLPLALATADCFPVLVIYKPLNLIALLHCGWKGADLRICSQLLTRWRRLFGAIDVSKIHVEFGPGICGSCYEVLSPRQLAQGNETSRKLWTAACAPSGDGRYGVDLKKFVTLECLEMGIKARHIHDRMSLCTYEKHELFYSHRRNDKERFMTVAMIMK